METQRRGADGRRLFTAVFKRDQLARVARQELALAELARELAVSLSVVRRWHRLSTKGSAAAVGASEEVVPASELRAAQSCNRDDQRAVVQSARSGSHARCWRILNEVNQAGNHLLGGDPNAHLTPLL